MCKKKISIFFLFLAIFFVVYMNSNSNYSHIKIESIKDVVALFPKNMDQIEKREYRMIEDSKKKLDTILALNDDERTFENTALALDRIIFELSKINGITSVVENTYTQEEMRNAARKCNLKIKNFMQAQILSNRKLYDAFKAYVNGNSKKEKLSPEREYFLQEMMLSFKKMVLIYRRKNLIK